MNEQYLPEESIGYLIFRINHGMHNFFREELDKEGINVVEAWVLLQILNGVKTVSELQKILKVDMAQIQRGCDRLIEMHWLTRTKDPYDKRIKILSITKDGESLIRRIISHSKETNRRALAHLNNEQNTQLKHLLMKVYEGSFFSE